MKKNLPPVSTQVTGARYCVPGKSASFRRTGAAVHLAGREECLQNYRIARTTYPTHALELVTQGKGLLVLCGREYRLQPGTVFAYGPGIPHEIRAEGSGLVKYFVDCSGPQVDRLVRAGLKPGRVASARHPEQMVSLFELLLARGGERPQVDAPLCSDYVAALLKLAAETLPADRVTGGNPGQTIRRAMILLSAGTTSFRSVADLASRLGVTPEHLARSFRNAGMESPSTLLAAKRMNHAAGLLLSGGRTVKQASYELGFSSPFHFSSSFRRHFGFPPSSLKSRAGEIS